MSAYGYDPRMLRGYTHGPVWLYWQSGLLVNAQRHVPPVRPKGA